MIPSKLPVRSDPIDDESFMGYVLRMSEANHMGGIQWLSRVFDRQKIHHLSLQHVPDIAYIFDAHIVNAPELCIFSCQESGHTIFSAYGHVIKRSFLLRFRHPQVCTMCLDENHFIRKSWDFSMMTNCPFHGLQLIDRCESCLKPLSWDRPGVCQCECGYDIRRSQRLEINEETAVFAAWLQERICPDCEWLLDAGNYRQVLSLLDNLSTDGALRVIWATGIKKCPEDQVDVGTGAKALSTRRAVRCIERSLSRLEEILTRQNIGNIRPLFSETNLRSLLDETECTADQALISQLLLQGKQRENPKSSLLHLNPLSQMRLF